MKTKLLVTLITLTSVCLALTGCQSKNSSTAPKFFHRNPHAAIGYIDDHKLVAIEPDGHPIATITDTFDPASVQLRPTHDGHYLFSVSAKHNVAYLNVLQGTSGQFPCNCTQAVPFDHNKIAFIQNNNQLAIADLTHNGKIDRKQALPASSFAQGPGPLTALANFPRGIIAVKNQGTQSWLYRITWDKKISQLDHITDGPIITGKVIPQERKLAVIINKKSGSAKCPQYILRTITIQDGKEQDINPIPPAQCTVLAHSELNPKGHLFISRKSWVDPQGTSFHIGEISNGVWTVVNGSNVLKELVIDGTKLASLLPEAQSNRATLSVTGVKPDPLATNIIQAIAVKIS